MFDSIEAAMPSAKEYVDRQLETMRKFGMGGDVSPDKYRKAILSVAEATTRLSRVAAKRPQGARPRDAAGKDS